MLQYTGHPLVDVGTAVIVVFSEKNHPEEVTDEDLAAVAGYIWEHYTHGPLRSFLTSVFPNSGYVNPSMKQQSREEFRDTYLFAFRRQPAASENVCVYCGRPAYTRAFRQHVPLLTGEGMLNFFPNADPGLPVCATCLLAIQAVPLGTVKCAGRILLVHAASPALTQEFVRGFLEANRVHLQLADLAKYPDKSYPHTVLVDELVKIATAGKLAEEEVRSSISVYHFTNYGTGADVDIYHLPLQLVDFVSTALQARYRKTWDQLVKLAWQKVDGEPEAGHARNYLYEDLFTLPDQAPRFVRTYLLRRAYRAGVRRDDPRADYTIQRDLDLISWEFTSLFLRKVMYMERERINLIREVGDRLATYIVEENDNALLQRLNRAKRYQELRVALIRANECRAKAGRSLLMGFDEFIALFEEGEDLPYPQWDLTRDLLLIRILEQLHAHGWFAQHANLLAAEEDGYEEPGLSTDKM